MGKIKHGMVKTKIYSIWQNMKRRCFVKNNQDYKNYGGRGITVCDEWTNSFKNFYKDVGDKPKNKTLDRIDNNKGYCKDNCRWATSKEQANNKTTSHYLIYDRKRKTIKQWSEELGINYFTLWKRINKHKWSTEKALNTFFKKKN